uniref:Uncharacterized protein n=1 Tax=Anguilla anguilla TaxID=7936 RepID=A0A0E9RXK1_ANGAN
MLREIWILSCFMSEGESNGMMRSPTGIHVSIYFWMS